MARRSTWRGLAELLLLGGLALVSNAGCYRPRLQSCVIACGSDGSCPHGMSCAAGLCTAGAVCTAAVSAGETHACAVRGGDVFCWGGNAYQQLGTAPATTVVAAQSAVDRPTPVQAEISSPLRPVMGVAAGGRHTCALGAEGGVVCWGDNSLGQLGCGDQRSRNAGDSPVALPARATSVVAGLYHTCALLADASVRCWGDNRFGQLGAGKAGNIGDEPQEAPAVVEVGGPVSQIAAGAYHTCVLLVDGTVKCWGANDFAQLGLGDLRSRGLSPKDMGAALSPVPLGAGLSAIAVAAGAFHGCAILVAPGEERGATATGRLKCWGANGGGRLGIGNAASSSGGSASDLGEGLPFVDLGRGRRVREVAAGGVHTCALLDDRSVRCWGYAADGELGFGTTDNRGAAPEDLGDGLPAVPVADGFADTLAAGAHHVCAVRGPDVTCWGQNDHGQLGTGDTANRGAVGASLVPVVFGSAR